MKSSSSLKRIAVAAIALTAVIIASCGSQNNIGTEINLFAMDTILSIRTASQLPSDTSDYCRSITDRLEKKLSVNIDTSEAAIFNRASDLAEVSEEVADIVRIALKVSALTNGAFDITIRPIVDLWDISHPDDGWKPPDDTQISTLLGDVGYEKLGVSQNNGKYFLTKNDPTVEIDLGGIGKGWAIGELAEYLSEIIDGTGSDGQDSYGTLSFGGNIAVYGVKPNSADFIVGVKNPFNPQTLIGTLAIPSGIIAVSGGYERYVDYDSVRYHHILDPSDGNPSNSDLVGVAVWVDTITPEAGALSDALSTAFFVMGSDKSLELLESGILEEEFGYKFGSVLIKTDGKIITTDNLSDRFVKQ